MQYLEKLQALKEQRKLTYNEIAQLSNIPETTVTRILNGRTQNPTLDNVIPIAIALGVSLDEVFGLSQPKEENFATPVATTLDSYAELLKEKDERIKDLKEEHEKMRKEKQRYGFALACVVAFVMLLLTIDILNGNFGYFRY